MLFPYTVINRGDKENKFQSRYHVFFGLFMFVGFKPAPYFTFFIFFEHIITLFFCVLRPYFDEH